ncbi:MAG TPA: tetratricopeptide repeat protein, partial [Sphingomonas sp.]
DVGGAADAAARAAQLAPHEPAALVLQGEVVRQRYGLIAALPWFDAALARDAYYPAALAEQAATLGDLGRNADMLAATRALLAARPGDARALYLQAVLAARAGKPDLSRRLLQATGSVLADLPGARLLKGALAFDAGQFEQAAVEWGRLAAAQPLNVSVRRLLAVALYRSGDGPAAVSVLRPVVLRADADSYALTLAAAIGPGALALVDRAAMTPGEARVFASDTRVATLRVEAAGAPADPTYALGAIRGMVAADQNDAAVAAARALVAATPGAPPAHLALGDALMAARRPHDALQAYARAADLRVDEPTMLRLVDGAARAGDRPQGARTLALYIAQNPQSVTARRLLGRWQVDAGEHAAAIETLEGVRRVVGSRDAILLADLALAYAGDDDGAVARVYGRAAYALSPMNARVADAYGVALAAAGEIEGARQLLAKAVALAPGDTAIAEHRRQLR